jgi:hypothetical protein
MTSAGSQVRGDGRHTERIFGGARGRDRIMPIPRGWRALTERDARTTRSRLSRAGEGARTLSADGRRPPPRHGAAHAALRRMCGVRSSPGEIEHERQVTTERT